MVSTEITEKFSIVDLVLSIVAGFILTLIFFALSAAVVTFLPVPDSAVPALSVVGSTIGLIGGGIFAVRNISAKGWLYGAISGIAYVIVFYLVSSIIKGSVSFDFGILFMLMLGFFAGAFGGIMGINVKFTKRRKF